MPRPLRIEYENAYYHVMNRGRGRQWIFHGADYFQAFLTTLEEAHRRFDLQVLCYCLMNNHYHLLVKTPRANLGRAMRHINGQYTQRFNRLKKTDGPLFRGRYKSILVEADSYQLQVSRYIHRNPLDAGMVEQLEDYPWSSYPCYLGKYLAPDWLYRQEIYDQLSVKSRQSRAYQNFVEQGVDEELATFYNKGNMMPFLGGDSFRDWAYRQRQTESEAVSRRELRHFRPTLEQLAESVAKSYGVAVDRVVTSQRGRVQENVPRWILMYLAQEVGDCTLREIADYLGLKRSGSIPTTLGKLRQRMAQDRRLERRVSKIISEYDT